MKKLRFKSSAIASIGIELEIQLIDPVTGDLKSAAKPLIRNLIETPFQKKIKPEVTQSMIEINSSIHFSMANLYEELLAIRAYLLNQASFMGMTFAGGGTHPFGKWPARKIFPTKRFKNLSRVYQFLSKQATVFGQHIHIGCHTAEDALYLTHALTRYVPHLIAMSASSPFYQAQDSGFQTVRLIIFNGYPFSGVMPYLTTWEEFTSYYDKLINLGIIHSIKDFYWDIRPKPEFGTVEIRVCDTPLTLRKATVIAAYAQALALYLLQERPFEIMPAFYDLYTTNRFQACRYGFEGEFIDPMTLQKNTIVADLQQHLPKIEKYAAQLNNLQFITELKNEIANHNDDSFLLRQYYKEHNNWAALIKYQSQLWENE